MSRGGRREGSGRKAAERKKVTISFRVTEEVHDNVQRLRKAGCEVNAALERMVSELMQEI